MTTVIVVKRKRVIEQHPVYIINLNPSLACYLAATMLGQHSTPVMVDLFLEQQGLMQVY